LAGIKEVSMRVHDLIESRQEIFSISDSTPVDEAARYLRDRKLRAVGVLNGWGKLAGIVSQSDISEKVAAENKCPAWMRVSEIMSTQLVTVTPETSLEECLQLMERNGIFHLLVVDDADFSGMISAKDLLRFISDGHKARADMLEAFVFPEH
jgi:CBS domain-containing protein